MSDQLLTMNDLLDRYQVTRYTIDRWVSDGEFPKPIWIGKRTKRWRLEDIQEYELQAQAQEGDS